MHLPLSLSAHCFIHISFFFCLMICLAVPYVADSLSWVHLAPSLASLSASSLPLMLQWPGIHCNVTWIPWVAIISLIVRVSFLITGSLAISLARACKTDFASERMTMLVLLMVFCLSIFETKLRLSIIAAASAS